jgi:hypothetical protein
MRHLKAETILLNPNLRITYYQKLHPAVKEVVDLCNQEAQRLIEIFLTKDPSICIFKVELATWQLHVVLSIAPPTASKVKRILKHGGLDEVLSHALYVVYNKRACWWSFRDGKNLIASIKSGILPEVYALLSE